MNKFTIVLFFIITASIESTVYSCDLCGCYTPQIETGPATAEEIATGLPTATALSAGRSWATGLYGALAEQFTSFGTLQQDGHEVPNPTGQYLDSSITQLVAGYGITKRFALQLNIPLIYRSFARPEGFEIDRGTESGLGDISLLGRFVAFHFGSSPDRALIVSDSKSQQSDVMPQDFSCSVVALAGIKFPTGDSSRIKEEFHEVEVPGAPESGIHGHDLTLGTGSYDGIFGGDASMRFKEWFFQAGLQFTLRGDGLHQYDFANDLSWSGGPGYYLVRKKDAVVGVQFVISGEHKDVDRFMGEPADDTGITSVFLGPRIIASVKNIGAELEVDLPVLIDNTAFQAVPDYRIRGGVAIHF
jgi:hypothetical protein